MSIGWFDAFRENGAPTWYGENRTPVRLDLGLAILLWLFLIPTLAFCLILPGIRRLRALSAFTFLFSMAVGASLALSIHYPGWHCGQLRVFTAFRAHTRQRIIATLGVNIGLTQMNITLNSESLADYSSEHPRRILTGNSRAHSIPATLDSDISMLLFGPDPPIATNQSNSPNSSSQLSKSSLLGGYLAASEEPTLYYNERFQFDDVSGMEVREVLQKGLPFPILRVVEYLSVDRTGFLWGKQYRLAGYYTQAALWLAFSLWILQMTLLCLLPHRFGQFTFLCGLCILFANALYALYTPGPAELFIIFPGPDDSPQKLHFHLSTCFYGTLIAGIASTWIGSLLWLLEWKSSFRLETFFSAYLDRMCRPHASRTSSKLWSTKSSRCLPTPKGSFTSLGHPDQSAIGWKRKRRSLRRTAKEWPGPTITTIMEMRERTKWKKERWEEEEEVERRGMDGDEEDCAYQSQPSCSTTSTRQIDDSGMESEEARSPRTPNDEKNGSNNGANHAFWPSGEWTPPPQQIEEKV